MLGAVSAEGGVCRWHAGSARIVCLATAWSGANRALAIADLATFVILATPVFQRESGSEALSEIVAGPRGQVARRVNTLFVADAADAVWLFASPALN